jgi:hypothetical protein
MFARDKCSSLFGHFVGDEEKLFYNVVNDIKRFFFSTDPK